MVVVVVVVVVAVVIVVVVVFAFWLSLMLITIMMTPMVTPTMTVTTSLVMMNTDFLTCESSTHNDIEHQKGVISSRYELRSQPIHSDELGFMVLARRNPYWWSQGRAPSLLARVRNGFSALNCKK